MICDRCSHKAKTIIMSMFNVQNICDHCKAVEIAHPEYDRARDAEHDAVMRKNYDFPGIGLPADLG